MKTLNNKIILLLILCMAIGGLLMYFSIPNVRSIFSQVVGQKSVSGVIKQIEPGVMGRLKPYLIKGNSETLPSKLALIALKDERTLELWGYWKDRWIHIKDYPILAASGNLGPKLKEGDRQVPEGIYKIIGINPNSYYHLAMLIDYPNTFDKEKAKMENRSNLGGDICIHGKSASAGCLAMGDEAIEELFYMVVKTDMKNTKVIISPYDFRNKSKVTSYLSKETGWMPELYDMIKKELGEFMKP
mgnify:CR=1 FL=1